jgi:hypothetical protein
MKRDYIIAAQVKLNTRPDKHASAAVYALMAIAVELRRMANAMEYEPAAQVNIKDEPVD